MGEGRVGGAWGRGAWGRGAWGRILGGGAPGTGVLGCSTTSRNPPFQGLPGHLYSTPVDPLLSAHTPALPAP